MQVQMWLITPLVRLEFAICLQLLDFDLVLLKLLTKLREFWTARSVRTDTG